MFAEAEKQGMKEIKSFEARSERGEAWANNCLSRNGSNGLFEKVKGKLFKKKTLIEV